MPRRAARSTARVLRRSVPIDGHLGVFPKSKIVHNFQTNGTLINDAWCEFFLKNNCSVGVSVDGPANIHDKHRKDRQGKGTHDKVMRGIEFLKKHKVPFHSISVITADALESPDEVFNFFLENEIHSVGFNIEEQEGIHQISTLGTAVGASPRIEKFMRRCYELQKASEGQVRIREFDRAFQALARTEEMDKEVMDHNDQSMAFGIISIDWQGNISTFSLGELLKAAREREAVRQSSASATP